MFAGKIYILSSKEIVRQYFEVIYTTSGELMGVFI